MIPCLRCLAVYALLIVFSEAQFIGDRAILTWHSDNGHLAGSFQSEAGTAQFAGTSCVTARVQVTSGYPVQASIVSQNTQASDNTYGYGGSLIGSNQGKSPHLCSDLIMQTTT